MTGASCEHGFDHVKVGDTLTNGHKIVRAENTELWDGAHHHFYEDEHGNRTTELHTPESLLDQTVTQRLHDALVDNATYLNGNKKDDQLAALTRQVNALITYLGL
jgi:hypothetical protein